jgi:hypothetical protein
MGLAVFGEKVAARTYALMAELKPEFGTRYDRLSDLPRADLDEPQKLMVDFAEAQA